MAGEVAGGQTDAASQFYVRQSSAGENNLNAFGRNEILLPVNSQSIVAHNGFDEREKVLIRGNGERGFAAGPYASTPC